MRVKSWAINQPAELKDCDPALLPPRLTAEAGPDERDLQTKSYSLDQAQAFNICRAKTKANTAIIEAHNKQVKGLSKHWWEFWK